MCNLTAIKMQTVRFRLVTGQVCTRTSVHQLDVEQVRRQVNIQKVVRKKLHASGGLGWLIAIENTNAALERGRHSTMRDVSAR